jgi:hypothetical protein
MTEPKTAPDRKVARIAEERGRSCGTPEETRRFSSSAKGFHRYEAGSCMLWRPRGPTLAKFSERPTSTSWLQGLRARLHVDAGRPGRGLGALRAQ